MPRLLAFAASLRRGSWNRKHVQLTSDIARQGGAEVDLAEFREFDMPLYDADQQAASGIPPGAEALGRLEGLGVLLHPDMYTLPWAEKAFGPDGRLIDQERQDRLAAMVGR